MPIQTIKKSSTCRLIIDSTSGTGIIQLPNLPLATIPNGMQILGENIIVNSITARASTPSLTPVSLPDVPLEASQAEATIIGLNLEWNSPRFQLDMFVGVSGSWTLTGSLSLLNVTPYPYRQYNLIDIYNGGVLGTIGDNCWLAFQIKNVGNGNLTATDSIAIWADFTREISVYEPAIASSSITNISIDETLVNRVLTSNVYS